MLSESARMASASEARFRVQAPNSLPRAIKVIALDRSAEAVVRRLATGGWQHASFLSAADSGAAPLHDLTGHPRTLDEAIGTADLVVMIAAPGGDAAAAALIGRACSDRRVMTTGCLVCASAAQPSDVARTLAQVRPWSLMMVTATSDDYLDDMLTALGG
jgi:hypothetical protein